MMLVMCSGVTTSTSSSETSYHGFSSSLNKNIEIRQLKSKETICSRIKIDKINTKTSSPYSFPVALDCAGLPDRTVVLVDVLGVVVVGGCVEGDDGGHRSLFNLTKLGELS